MSTDRLAGGARFIGRRIATVGVFGFTVATLLAAPRAAPLPPLVDVRQRRGVRGPQYAWANARRLQAALAEAGVEYRHHKELAPTTELRRLQYAEDARRGEGKRSRSVLAAAYAERYTREILDRADLVPLVEELPRQGAAALFCVEADPEACHRSLVATRLSAETGLPVAHIRPS